MTISSSVQKALLSEDFGRLEEISIAYRSEKSRTSSGIWKLTLFYGGIQLTIDALAQVKGVELAIRELEDKADRWVRKYPASPSAHITRSMLLIHRAWAYRGAGYASEVRHEDWAPFHKYINLARQNLENNKRTASIDPRWYETMLTIARAQSWDRRQFDQLLEEALGKEPHFYQTYFLALEYLLPKWHGGAHDIEAFANDAVKRTSKQEGRGMYARIYWFASQTQFQDKVFADSLVAWPRMRDGFEDVVARYPDAWNFNNYAKFACLAMDKAKARELLRRTGDAIVSEAWDPPSLLARCRAWVAR